MKLKTICFLIIFCGLMISCDKENSGPKDFRDKYIGKYQVTESIDCYGSCVSCSSQIDTVISVKYGSTDSSLSVLGRNVTLDSTGFYYAYHYGLQFRNDSIYSNFMNGGLGCGQYEVYNGYRISEKP